MLHERNEYHHLLLSVDRIAEDIRYVDTDNHIIAGLLDWVVRETPLADGWDWHFSHQRDQERLLDAIFPVCWEATK